VSDAERIEALEARVRELERIIQTVVHFIGVRPSRAQTYSSAPAAGTEG